MSSHALHNARCVPPCAAQFTQHTTHVDRLGRAYEHPSETGLRLDGAWERERSFPNLCVGSVSTPSTCKRKKGLERQPSDRTVAARTNVQVCTSVLLGQACPAAFWTCPAFSVKGTSRQTTNHTLRTGVGTCDGKAYSEPCGGKARLPPTFLPRCCAPQKHAGTRGKVKQFKVCFPKDLAYARTHSLCTGQHKRARAAPAGLRGRPAAAEAHHPLQLAQCGRQRAAALLPAGAASRVERALTGQVQQSGGCCTVTGRGATMARIVMGTSAAEQCLLR